MLGSKRCALCAFYASRPQRILSARRRVRWVLVVWFTRGVYVRLGDISVRKAHAREGMPNFGHSVEAQLTPVLR